MTSLPASATRLRRLEPRLRFRFAGHYACGTFAVKRGGQPTRGIACLPLQEVLYLGTLATGRRDVTIATMHRAAPRPAQQRWPWVETLLLATTLAVYWRTLAPGALGGDAGELQFVPYILSLPHPTGTPLYVLLGKLWSLLPLGPSVAWRMNLLAAVSAALAVVVVYRIVIHWGHGPLPGLAAALTLGFGATFWEQATLADKYAFNALMVAGVLALALHWGATRSPRTLHALAFAYGLSLAHHRTMILFAPPLLGYVWALEGNALWRDGRRLLRLALLFLAPLSLYLYLPWAAARGLPPGTWQPQGLHGWFAYLFDTGRTGLVYIDMSTLGERMAFYGRTLWSDFGGVGVALGLYGLAMQLRRRRADALLLLAGFVLQAFLALNHHVPRHWVYFIPSFLIFALWVGEGLAALPAWTLGRSPRVPWSTRAPALLIVIVVLVWALVPWPGRYRALREAHLGAGTLDPWRQTLKTGHMADRLGLALADVATDAVIVADWEQATPLWYYQQVEGLRPDVTILYPMERLDEALATGRPVYLARTLPGLGAPWRPWAETPLVALRDAPTTALPASATPVGQGLGGVIELAGYTLHPTVRGGAGGPVEPHPGEVVALTVYWRALATPQHDYSVSLRLYDAAGAQLASVDSQHPVLGMYPTSAWTPGEVVADYYELQIPRALGPSELTWRVVLYRALPEGGWENLPLDGAPDQSEALGGTIRVAAR